MRVSTGEGARLAGGRWNSPGHAVVYMADSTALAVLENLVHMHRQDFPRGYVCVAAVIPDDLVVLAERVLRLRGELRYLTSEALGDWWIASRTSVVLKVASAVVPGEHIYLLNPAHPDFNLILVEPPALFHFDERLFPGDPP